MINCVEKFLNEFEIKNKTVILGFSSGPDSCALALILSKLAKKFDLKIVLAYFNHGWRKEAELEEEFTKEFAKKNNCEFYIEKAPSNIKKSEETARNLRYEFFENCAKHYNTDIVFLAHNKNDNIETLIYRVIKGTSIKGLASIPINRGIFYRPLLKITKDEILKFLKDEKQDYMIDSSNDDTKYKRNLIRNKILPLFFEINENCINNIEILIQNAIASSKIIENEINEIQKNVIADSKIKRTDFLALKKEYCYEILNNYLKDYLKARDYKTIEKLYLFIKQNENSKTSINKDSFLVVKNNFIFIEKNAPEKKSTLEVEIKGVGEYVFKNFTLKIEKLNKKFNKKVDKFFKSDEPSSFLELDFSTPYVLRHRKNGDTFCPFGLKKGKMKLKDYLINNKIPPSKKDELILLCKGGEVFWIIGNKISEKCRVQSETCYKLNGVFHD